MTAVAVLAAVGGGYVALSGGSPNGTSYVNAAAVVHGTSARATQVGTSSLDLTMTMSIDGHDVSATGDGAFDYRKHLGRVDLDMAGLGTMQEIVTRHAIFMRMPDGMAGVMATGGKPWLELRFSALKAAGLDMNKLMNSNPTADPASMLRVLSDATGIKQTGTETIDGASTTRYSATGSIGDLLRAEGVNDVVDTSKLPADVTDSQLHFDVWVDHTGLPRRLTMTMDLAGMGTMTMTMHFYGFGDPVTVIVPPKSVVTDISNLAGL
ncbi:MAG TPA: hypothetical protein VH274_04115 [Mycobacteriales bacterium]|nr:hypothetical protein [Mycobacteriales bacterium]